MLIIRFEQQSGQKHPGLAVKCHTYPNENDAAGKKNT